MPRLPRVSGAQAVRALERLGFVVARQRGSRIVLRRGAAGCVVPNHRELKTGTLRPVCSGRPVCRLRNSPPNFECTQVLRARRAAGKGQLAPILSPQYGLYRIRGRRLRADTKVRPSAGSGLS